MSLFSSPSLGGAEAPAQSSPELLRYYSARHVSPQWRAFLVAMSSGLFNNAEEADAREFLNQVGADMAALLPLQPVETLQDLEKAMNQVLGSLDWGFVKLTAEEAGIHIVLQAAPASIAEDQAGNWPRTLAAVLEGIFTAWFRSQGSQPHLVTRCSAASLTGPFEFRHGR